MKKYILVHSGARDYYKVAEYLEKNDCLAFLVTDDIFFRKAYRNLLPWKKVKISFIALFYRVLEKLLPHKKFNQKKDFWLSRMAGKLSNKKKYPVFALSYYATEAFSISTQMPKVLFQMHPQPKSVKRIFENEMMVNPLSKKSLSQEIELQYTKEEFDSLAMESSLASHYIVTCSFTKHTLIENGVISESIEVVPHGVDVSKFVPRNEFRVINKGECVRLLFVGSFNQRKGFSYLLQAVSELQKENVDISLTLCGRGIMDYEMLSHFAIKALNVYTDIPLNELVHLMHESDVFVFPSLCEGFGLVLLETMATGLPVITTDRTGGLDFITNGIEGYVIDAQNVNQIKEHILKFVENPELIKQMGMAAIQKARQYTWDEFGGKLVAAIQKFESTINS